MKIDQAAAAAGGNNGLPPRLYGLDTLRGLAAVLVVLLHAGIPYMACPLSHLVWPARDGCPCPIVDGVVWGIECFIMPLFFLLAGFLSAGLVASSGARLFLAHRTQRILWPLLGAFVVILPPCFYIWALGWIADGIALPRGIIRLGIPSELRSQMFGLTHLWFLEYLYIYCVVLGAAWYIRSRMGFGDRTRAWSARMASRCDRFLASRWKPLLPAVPCGLILYWDPRIVVGFYQGFLPVASKLLYYAVFFGTGVMLYRTRHVLQLQVRNSKFLLALAAVVFAVLLPLIHQQLTGGLTGVNRSILAGLLALYASLATFGLFGAFVLTRRGYNSATRYLAEASYWIYLVHLPFVVLAQIAVARLAVPTPFKFALSVLAAMTLALLTYQSFVRYTWVGAALNGCRRQRAGTIAAGALGGATVVSMPAVAVPVADGKFRDAA